MCTISKRSRSPHERPDRLPAYSHRMPMLRRQLLDHRTQDADPNAFRWRGTDVSRLEGFTDAILGFAITLVVVSLDVPDTLDGLLLAMRGFVPFGLCFAYLVLIWYEHNIYFRRYGLNTLFILYCNTALLFVILMYVLSAQISRQLPGRRLRWPEYPGTAGPRTLDPRVGPGSNRDADGRVRTGVCCHPRHHFAVIWLCLQQTRYTGTRTRSSALILSRPSRGKPSAWVLGALLSWLPA